MEADGEANNVVYLGAKARWRWGHISYNLCSGLFAVLDVLEDNQQVVFVRPYAALKTSDGKKNYRPRGIISQLKGKKNRQ